MTDRIAEQGAVQYAQNNPTSTGVSRLGAAGAIQAAIADALTDGKAALNGSRIGGKGRIYALAASAGPLFLFQNSEKGVWYDPSDLSTIFQDSEGTTAGVVGQSVGLMLDKSGNGYHATQATSMARPTLQVDANGKYYLAFDGVDDFMVTPSIDFTATDKMSVFAGVRKLSDAAIGTIASLADNETTQGTFAVYGPSGGGIAKYSAALYGTVRSAIAVDAAAPTTSVLSCSYDIAGAIAADETKIRLNGTLPAQTVILAGPSGTGNFSNNVLWIGKSPTKNPFNGRLYSLIVRGALSDTAQIAAAEAYVNSKTGAY